MHPTELLLATLQLGGGTAPEHLRVAWSTAPAPRLERLVQFEGCALWLHRRLTQIGARGSNGGRFTTWLAQRARDDAARNLLVDAQTADVVRTLTAHGIPHVLVKGVARRALAKRLPFADARATVDVDALVEADRAEEAWRAFRAEGYELAEPEGRTPSDHFHLPPLWNAARVAVELHTSTGPLVSSDEAWRRATTGGMALELDGMRVLVPAATELLWHGLTHAVRRRADTFRLRFLLDGAAILAADVEIDWETICRRLATAEAGPFAVACAWLQAAAELAGVSPPAPVRGARRCLHLLRALRWRQSVLRWLNPSHYLAGVMAAEGVGLDLGEEWGYSPRSTRLQTRVRGVRAAAARGAYRVWSLRGARRSA